MAAGGSLQVHPKAKNCSVCMY